MLRRRYNLGAYRTLLEVPGTTAFFVPAAVARLGVAMTSLAILWAVHGATGSFKSAGLVTATFATTQAIAGPQVARLIDRYGQRRVLSYTLVMFGLTAYTLAISCALQLPLGALAPLASLVGASVPQVGALAAGRWRHSVGGTDQMTTALSLEAALNDVSFLIGPILVTTLSATVDGSAGLALATTLIVVGLKIFLEQRDSELLYSQ